MNRVRIGIIGCGFIAGVHARVLVENPNVELVAVCDLAEDRARSLAGKYGAKNHYTDFHEMLERESIDAVEILLPHHLHVEVTVAAAEAGKHLLVEKPMATNVYECDRMIQAARKAGVKLMIAHNKRFDSHNELLKKLVDEGRLGTIVLARSVYSINLKTLQDLIPSKWRLQRKKAGGGVLTDMAVHYLDLLRWVVPGEVKKVSALTALITEKESLSPDVEDNGVIMLQFTGGAIATVQASWSIDVPLGLDEEAEVWGTGGRIRTKAMGMSPSPYHPMQIFFGKDVLGNLNGEIYPNMIFDPYESFKKENDHFIRCILENEEPRITGEDGRKTIACLEAAYDSAATGKTVALLQ